MKKIVGGLLLAAILSACSSTADQKAAIAEVPVVAPVASVENDGMFDPSNKLMNPLTESSSVIAQRNIYFDFDSFLVKSDYRDMLSTHAKYLSTTNTNIVIQGNTDNRGTAEYNLALGQKRAEAVKKVLNLLGVPDSQIETVSFGKERPKTLMNTDEAWAENRRADMVYQGEVQ